MPNHIHKVKFPRSNTSRFLLLLLSQTGKTVFDTIELMTDLNYYFKPFMRHGYGYVKELKKLKKQKDIKLAILRLKRGNYIKNEKIGNKIMFSLTNKGQLIGQLEKFKNAPLHPAGKTTVVIFDIPESQSATRRQFRLFLKQTNFNKLQKSVWINKHDVYNLTIDFVKSLKAKDWIYIFETTNIYNS